jgi:transposase InsO family protein
MHHSDCAAQYTSVADQAPLAAHRLPSSLSGSGSCYDNAVVESFFHTLKTELLSGRVFADRASAHAAIFKYIEVWYNCERSHSILGYESPLRYEERCTT